MLSHLYDESSNQKKIEFGKSLKNLTWKLLEQDERIVGALCQKLKIDDILARILVNRGVLDGELGASFIDPKLRDLLPNPFILKDMEKAADRIAKSIITKEKVTIFADYDVDGATSAAVLYKFYKELGVTPEIYIPSRLKEGYGPSAAAMEQIKKSDNTLVITVDCGTTAFEPLKVAKNIGLDVIVIDHHLALVELPDVYAVVNPNRIDDDFAYKSIAAVAVTFFVIIAVRQQLRTMNWFSQDILEPDLMQFLDLVALGTVCDVMPLTHINRVFVKHGLKLIAQRRNLGISTLFNIIKLDTIPQCYHLGFVLGPRINAGGRVSEGGLGAALLTTNNEIEAYNIAVRLEQLNDERKSLEAQALAEAIAQVQKNNCANNPIIIVVGKDWHIGILGILASRIKEQYHKPSAVISITNGVGKGSARSIPGIDLGSKISSAKAKGLLLEGGGHAMAGGFTVLEEKIADFENYLIENINKSNDSTDCFNKACELEIDAVISVKAANYELLKATEKAAPFGHGNPQPRFAICNAKIIRTIIINQLHLLLIIADSMDVKKKNVLKCMLFRGAENELGKFLLNNAGSSVNLIGTLQANELYDSKVKFIVEDIAIYD